MRKAKQHLLMSLAIFAVAFVAVIVLIAASASGAVQTMSEATKAVEAPEIVPVHTEVKKQAPESVSDVPESVPTYQQPIEAVEAPQPQQSVESKQQLERIPFTNKPVTAGEPESYVDTYGQCPFYENAGPKGCVPPPDIECNADWSKCEYVGIKQ